MLLFLKIFPQLLTTIIAWLVTDLDYKDYDKRKIKFKVKRKWLVPLYLVLLVISIVSISYDEYDKTQKEHELKNQIEKLNVTIKGYEETNKKGFEEASDQNTLINNSPNVKLRVRAIRLSKDMLQFLSERQNNQPSFPTFDYRTQPKSEFHRQADEIGKYSIDTSIKFVEKFGVRWESVVKELKSNGITSHWLKDSVQDIKTNSFSIAFAATDLGVAALQMPE